MNKLDLEAWDPLELVDHVEKELGMTCTPMTWPVGGGRDLRGVYDLRDRALVVYEKDAPRGTQKERRDLGALGSDQARAELGAHHDKLADDIALLQGAATPFDPVLFGRGQLTPVFFGSALHDFGVQELLDCFCDLAPPPQPRETRTRVVDAEEEKLSGFVFKIQANMDPNHRDRIAFVRVVSGTFRRGMKLWHERLGKELIVRNAMTFLARDRSLVDEAFPGDIIGIPNHGTIRIADTFTEGEALQFTGIPNFAPELFRRVRLKDPMKQKQLAKGLAEVCEEGAAQLFRPLVGSDWIVGALGSLQFDVIEARLRDEYGVDAAFESMAIQVCRWVEVASPEARRKLEDGYTRDLFTDGAGHLCVLSETRFRADYIADKTPGVTLHKTRELHG